MYFSFYRLIPQLTPIVSQNRFFFTFLCVWHDTLASLIIPARPHCIEQSSPKAGIVYYYADWHLLHLDHLTYIAYT